MAVDPTNSVIKSTKEQSYYDDLVTLADVELPNWPFELQDADLLPEVDEDEDQEPLDQASLDVGTPAVAAARAAAAGVGQMQAVQAAAQAMHGGALWTNTDDGSSASSASAPTEMPAPAQERATRTAGDDPSPTSEGADSGGKRKRARVPKKTLSEEELREKRMIAQRAYRQRMGRATELRKVSLKPLPRRVLYNTPCVRAIGLV